MSTAAAAQATSGLATAIAPPPSIAAIVPGLAASTSSPSVLPSVGVGGQAPSPFAHLPANMQAILFGNPVSSMH
jgi:hypothetical protein